MRMSWVPILFLPLLWLAPTVVAEDIDDWESVTIYPGESWAMVFETSSNSSYYCHPHPPDYGYPWFVGWINVSSEAPPTTEITIWIMDYNYSPAEVVIQPGTMVTWVNNDTVPHTATSSNVSYPAGHGVAEPDAEEEPSPWISRTLFFAIVMLVLLIGRVSWRRRRAGRAQLRQLQSIDSPE